MTTQTAATMQRVQETDAGNRSNEVLSEFSEMYDLIAQRAYELFKSRGAVPGHDKDDWLQAEYELLHPVPLNLFESIGEYIVQAEAPGFRQKDLLISVEPRRVVISGERSAKLKGKAAKLLCSDVAANRILRIVELPSEIVPARTTTVLEDGILTVELPKLEDAD